LTLADKMTLFHALRQQDKIDSLSSGNAKLFITPNYRGKGWGGGLPQRFPDCFHHRIKVAHDLIIRKPDDAVLLLLVQPLGSFLVVLDLLRVSISVNLDDELGCGAQEIHDERPDGVLLANVRATPSAAGRCECVARVCARRASFRGAALAHVVAW
jgi:hypothetical protein